MPSVIRDGDHSRNMEKVQVDYLQLAGCNLDSFIAADTSRPSFLEITGISTHKKSTCSGLAEGDYNNLASLLNHSKLSQLKVINKVPLPPEIMESFSYMECHCLMGVFPEIGRVWLTIDSNIYVWAFEHGTDVAYFDGLNETIVSVGLVKPKPGVFQNIVKYLLVLTTTVEIVVLGVTFTSSKSDGSSEFEEMHLVPDPVFLLSTDGVAMMCIKSTAQGRIFMGGKDGCLYEVTYQAQLGWFGKHGKKVNHSTSTLSYFIPAFINAALYDEDAIVKIEVDNSRHILYTLSEKGCIELYDLGRDGLSTSRITRLAQARIASLAFDIISTIHINNFKPVIAISAVEESESGNLNLVAVSHTGVRMYFSTSYEGINAPDMRPSTLTMLHVRLPPGFTPDSSMHTKNVNNAVYENGTLLMVCSGRGAEMDQLWCLSRVLPGEGSFSEAHTLLPLDGPAFALTSLPSKHSAHLSPALLSKKDAWAVSRWAVVTVGGAAILAAGAAPDLLRTLLRDCRGPDAQPVKDFFRLHSLEQACACALYLACEDSNSGDTTINEWASRAFFLYGSQPARVAPQMSHNQSAHMSNTAIGSPSFLPRQISTPMTMRSQQGVHPGLPQSPYQDGHFNSSQIASPNQSFAAQSPYRHNIASPTSFNQSSFIVNGGQQMRDQNVQQIEYTAKHNGLYIYVARILAPVWSLKCVTKSSAPDNQEYMSSNVTGEDCAHVVKNLHRVYSFIQRVGAPPQSDEYISLTALKQFLALAIELLSLWKVLCEHQFHVVAATLPQEQQEALNTATFRNLLIGGQEIACLLLGSLVAGYLRDNASVDGISEKLRSTCPTLYRKEDAACSKANELLIFARQQKNQAEKEEMLQHALKLCKEVAPNVNLPVIASKLVSAGFYSGVVELCVTCANKIDPQDKALHYYKSEQPSQDREGHHLLYCKRMEMYQEVRVVLERLYERSMSGAINDLSAPPQHCTGDQDVTLSLTPAEANYQGRKLIWECLSRDDELLHVAVYEWLVSKQLGSELLSLGATPPASLRTYLQTAARNAPTAMALRLLDLLWKVLEKSGDHLAAAHVLEGLATRPGTGATLSERMSWLSAGVVCVRGAGAGGGELGRRLEETGEVALVQAQVERAISALPPPLRPPESAVRRLHDELLDITQLYEDYADRYNLWECKLAIVQCAGYNDALLVETIWSNILGEAEMSSRGLSTPDERLGSVLSKLTTLGKEYINTGHCFPLYFIVRHLETISCKLQADHSMVFKAVLNIGVPIEQVLDIYIKLVSVNERVWLACGDEVHVCRVCTLLLGGVRDDVLSLPAPARRRALARCKDLHEAALSALQSRPNTKTLIDRLLSVHVPLDRLD